MESSGRFLRTFCLSISSRAGVVALAAISCLFTAGALLAQDVRAGSQQAAVQLPAPTATSDSASVVATVVAYRAALAAGDSAAALSLLTEDALILESGGMETREEYRSHHLPSDIQFAAAVRATEGQVRVTVRGDVAWAASTSVTQGTFRGRPVNSVGAELMVLTRSAGGWKIAAIHWSSRARRP